MATDRPELTYNSLTMQESLPGDISFLDAYQVHTWNQIIWDENGYTIKGKREVPYMVDGIVEEVFELIIGPDKVEPEYSRLGSLLHDPEAIYSVGPGEATTTAVTRHAKEFGDVSWYTSNLLHILGVKLSRAYEVGLLAWELDIKSNPRMDEVFAQSAEREVPGFFLIAHAGGLSAAASELRDRRRDERLTQEQKVVIAAGKFLLASMHVGAARFGSSYEAFLRQNKEKLAKRIVDNTVFDKAGGDDR